MSNAIQYLIEILNQDPLKPWITVKSFERREMAISFVKRLWRAEEGCLCLISEEATGYVVESASPELQHN